MKHIISNAMIMEMQTCCLCMIFCVLFPYLISIAKIKHRIA